MLKTASPVTRSSRSEPRRKDELVPRDTYQRRWLCRNQDVVDATPRIREQAEDETSQSCSPWGSTCTLQQEQWIGNRATLSIMLPRLQSHYQDEVAPKLQWIDAPSNPWRSILLPLSRSSTALQYAILGFSATHLYVTSCAQRPSEICDFPHRLRLKATESLNAQIDRQLHRRSDTGESNATSIIEIVATMLVLCHIEMLMPGSKDWTLHMKACREVSNLERHAVQLSGSAEPVMDFLDKALADLEAFESPFSFISEPDVCNNELRQPAPRDSFWIFLAVVREVTFTERVRHTRQTQGLRNPDIDRHIWTEKVERARLLAFSHPSFILDALQPLRVVFRMVANAHYYAGLIYCYQALAHSSEVESLLQSSADALFCELQSVAGGEWRNFDHDLFWPLFIAGTQSLCNTRRQADIEGYYHTLMASTGFWCNAEALKFLRSYWTEAPWGLYDSWIHFARAREAESGSFLVY